MSSIVGKKARLTRAHIEDLKKAGLYYAASDLRIGVVDRRMTPDVWIISFDDYGRALHRDNFEIVD